MRENVCVNIKGNKKDWENKIKDQSYAKLRRLFFNLIWQKQIIQDSFQYSNQFLNVLVNLKRLINNKNITTTANNNRKKAIITWQ